MSDLDYTSDDYCAYAPDCNRAPEIDCDECGATVCDEHSEDGLCLACLDRAAAILEQPE